MYEIVFIDTETTGIHPEREIWEIAMVGRTSDGKESAPVVMQVGAFDLDLSKADPFGLSIGKFYERYYTIDDRVNSANVYSAFGIAEKVWRFTKGAHVVGAVPNFDTESLDKLLRRNKLIPAWHYHLIDVETLAIGFLKGFNLNKPKGEELPFKFPWKSDDLSRAIGVEPPSEEERHTALGDVKWAIRTYDKVMGIN